MSNTVRIATVTATGNRYLVQRLTVGKTQADSRVHCWGEVTAYRGCSTKHGESKTFTADSVTVTEVAKTPKLVEELFQQQIAMLQAKGNVITSNRTGTKYTNHGTPEQMAATRERQAKLQSTLRTFFTAPSGYRQPNITEGGLRPLPETREEIRAKILDKLTAPGAKPAFRQEYSNGEFISNSLIVGTSLAAIADRSLDLDGAQHVAFFDADLGLWWRQGGCFD